MAKKLQKTEEWTTGLCGCFDHIGICCFGAFCRPCLYGQTAAKIEGRDSCLVNCCLYAVLHTFCLCACLAKQKRKDLREKYNLKHGKCCGDFAVHCFCSPCAVCQDARELNNRQKAAPAQFVTSAPPQQVML